ncbi:MAG: HupE/UreJ family protein [Erythrobacter sp.]
MWRITALLALIFLAAFPARADEIRPFTIELREVEAGAWQMSWKQPLSGPDKTLIVPAIPENCALQGDPISREAELALIGNAQLKCDGELGGQTFALAQLTGNSDALLRITPIDKPTQSHRLTSREPAITIAADQSAWDVAKTYFIIGMEHILAGWDHLLFVIALVLLVVKGWAVVKAATAFTIAHSITLAATVLGFTGLPQAPVEALIALSIVFLAVELMRTNPDTWTRRFPWAVAFAFGLLHGFGFAGALREIGLPQGEVPTALLTFNLGVEAGQLLVVAAVIALRAIIHKFAPQIEARVVKAATYGIGIIAAYWLIDRVL